MQNDGQESANTNRSAGLACAIRETVQPNRYNSGGPFLCSPDVHGRLPAAASKRVDRWGPPTFVYCIGSSSTSDSVSAPPSGPPESDDERVLSPCSSACPGDVGYIPCPSASGPVRRGFNHPANSADNILRQSKQDFRIHVSHDAKSPDSQHSSSGASSKPRASPTDSIPTTSGTLGLHHAIPTRLLRQNLRDADCPCMGGVDNSTFLQDKRRKAHPASYITFYLLDVHWIAGSKTPTISMGSKGEEKLSDIGSGGNRKASRVSGCENCWQRLGWLENCLMCWSLDAAPSKVQRPWNVGNQSQAVQCIL